jgi:hypothetical protein
MGRRHPVIGGGAPDQSTGGDYRAVAPAGGRTVTIGKGSATAEDIPRRQVCSAFVGSTRVALLAGITLAANATAAKTPGTSTNVTGSLVPIP